MAKKRFISKVIVVLLSIAIILPNLFTLAYASSAEVLNTTTQVRKGIVTAGGLNFREDSSLSSKIIRVLPRGTIVTIIEEADEWLKVEHEAETGYLYKSHVEYVYSTGITTATRLYVRSEPNANSKSLALLSKGSKVSIIETVKTDDSVNPEWLLISYLNGNTGYVSKRYVNILTNSDGTFFLPGTTTADLLNFREEPGTSGKILSVLHKDTFVIVLDSIILPKDYYVQWYKVEHNGQIGWISGKYLELGEWVQTSTARTTSSGSGKNRNHNMSLATTSLSGTILFPGETFSWIKTMGSCSAEKGYLTATIFVNGKHSEGAGGGVCQVSTTINMAVKKAGIPTNARQHSLEVSYARREDEATVSYPYVDFSFVNTLDVPILLELVSNKGTVTCNVYVAK